MSRRLEAAKERYAKHKPYLDKLFEDIKPKKIKCDKCEKESVIDPFGIELYCKCLMDA